MAQGFGPGIGAHRATGPGVPGWSAEPVVPDLMGDPVMRRRLLDELVDEVVERVEQRVIDELERRGARGIPGGL